MLCLSVVHHVPKIHMAAQKTGTMQAVCWNLWLTSHLDFWEKKQNSNGYDHVFKVQLFSGVTFKVATLTYRALHGSAPPYLASSFTCVADMLHRRRLRFASTDRLDVPTCRLSTVGDRAFPVAGAKVWNGLPSDVTSASSLAVFKNRLKTYLFRRCYETV